MMLYDSEKIDWSFKLLFKHFWILLIVFGLTGGAFILLDMAIEPWLPTEGFLASLINWAIGMPEYTINFIIFNTLLYYLIRGQNVSFSGIFKNIVEKFIPVLGAYLLISLYIALWALIFSLFMSLEILISVFFEIDFEYWPLIFLAIGIPLIYFATIRYWFTPFFVFFEHKRIWEAKNLSISLVRGRVLSMVMTTFVAFLPALVMVALSMFYYYMPSEVPEWGVFIEAILYVLATIAFMPLTILLLKYYLAFREENV